MNDRLEPIRAVFRQCGLYNHAADDLLCERLAEAMTPKACAGDLDRAIAAAREALDNHDYGHEIPAYVVRNLLTALDAARGEAVAYRFWDTEQDRWQWGEAACAEKDDELLYAAPPAAVFKSTAKRVAALQARDAEQAPPAAAVSAEGWKEAAIAWEVCASIHRKYAKGRDAMFSTRQQDFVTGAEKARAILKQVPPAAAVPAVPDGFELNLAVAESAIHKLVRLCPVTPPEAACMKSVVVGARAMLAAITAIKGDTK